jgi:autophagy-related protein 9
MHEFYHYLLDIPDRDIQTVSWQYVVSRLMALRDANLMTAQNVSPRSRKDLGDQSKERMDAHDIANRLMRRHNYLIALFNKDILDLTVPIPFLGKRQFFSKTTEALVSFCVLDFVFDKRNQVNRKFLTDRNRAALVENLKNRFVRAGYLSILGAPLAVIYFLVSYFLKYFTVSNA